MVVGAAALASFIAAFAAICADPYWEDNGVVAFIPWGERWSWAALFMPLFLLPIGVAAYLLWPFFVRQRKP